LEKIRNPKDSVKDLLIEIQEASNNGDSIKKAELKKNLFAFTPCVNVKKRRAYSDIINFTGLAVLDFDKIDNATEFKTFLFETYSSIIAAWLSPSKKGIKALVKIPEVDSIDEFKSYFYGIAEQMQNFNGFDITSQNSVLLLFIGFDPDILIREDYTEWMVKGVKVNEFSKSKPVVRYDITTTDNQKQWVVNWYSDKMNAINTEAHPQVRDNSVALGGYVAAGYITEYEAISLSEYLISINGYMKKGVSGYQKTANQSIRYGQQKPLYFSK